MTIYYLLLLFWIICYIIFNIKEKKTNNDNILFFITFLSLTIIMILRKYTVGCDIKQYLYVYNNLLPFYMKIGIVNLKEPAFFLILFIMKHFNFSDQMYIATFSIIEMLLLSIFIKRNSKNTFLSFFLFVTAGLFPMFMSGIRQSIAICIMIVSTKYIFERKKIKYLLCCILAILFHNSAVIFIPVYFLYNIKIKKNIYFWLIPILIIIVFIFSSDIFKSLNFLIPLEYQNYLLINTVNKVNILVILEAAIIPYIYLFFVNKKEFNNKKMKFFLNLSLINLILNIFSINSIWISRLSFYYCMANIILIPNLIHDIKNGKMKLLCIYCLIVIGFLRFCITIPGGVLEIDKYLFFWQ